MEGVRVLRPRCVLGWTFFVLSSLLLVEGGRFSHLKETGIQNQLLRDEQPILSEAMVAAINSHNGAGWVAGLNERLADMKLSDFRVLCGSRRRNNGEHKDSPVNAVSHSQNSVVDLPKHFDAREAWPHCPSLSHIRDQGHCGSCWAFGAVEALSDRLCIKFNESRELSANDILACCGDDCGDGCSGGYPIAAWEYFMNSGVVSLGCDPYFDQVGCHHPGCSPLLPTPTCAKSCVDGEAWATSKRYSSNAYVVGPSVKDIMIEVYTNGPVEVDFVVFEDFAHYKSGVYRHIFGVPVGGHAVKLIGWGTSEMGVDYWLCANSWNRSWGDDGYFKIRRGTNECSIEGDVTAGIPSLVKVAGDFLGQTATI